jgi:hypothetical protein
MSDTYYCDDYEALTGRQREDGQPIETKVVEAPSSAAVKVSVVKPETK